jgi:uncharacterized protein involved in cysteine biosynthesis
MKLLDAAVAPFKGFQLCLADRELRALALRPWGLGAVLSLLSLVVGFILLPDSGFWQIAVSALLMLVVTLVITVGGVLILGAYYHSRISFLILSRAALAKEELSLGKEVVRTAVTESLKLLWLVPLYIILLIIGLIPLLTIPAFLLGGLLVAYQFLDIPLDHLHYGAFSRFGYALKNILGAVVFGGVIILLGTIPFAALFIAPVAVAGASWLIAQAESDKSGA